MMDNDYIHLSQVSENNQASHLLKLLITTSSVCDLKGLFTLVMAELKDIVDFDSADLLLHTRDVAVNHNRLCYTHGRVTGSFEADGLPPLTAQVAPGQVHRSHWVKALPAGSVLFKRETTFEYTWYIPFTEKDTVLAVLQFRTNRKGGFNARNGAVLHIIEKILTPKFLDLIKKATAATSQVSAALAEEQANDREEQEENNTVAGELIGRSDSMKKILFLLSEVAQTQSSVLILGETGTGKELVARALHHGSSRRNKPMIKINCAALPPNIIESELFGHERGSFTGAIERRIGKFEQANNSTLFLDEVGELPLELQVKLLRALQEKEIERIGGKGVIKINVRIIAATNRDLLKEVRKGNFRSDLYFRLNVFPITLPPLRERKEDVPLLAMHFLAKHTKKDKKPPTGFSAKVLKQLKAHDWPGNVRELEHLIERTALLSNGPVISELPVSLGGTEELGKAVPEIHVKTIDQVEREHIVSILKKCNGKVAGVGGAAEALKIPSSTLNSKMRRLNIKRGYINTT